MPSAPQIKAYIEFEDNRLLPLLFGEHDHNIRQVEQALEVHITARGNQVVITGEIIQVEAAQEALKHLYERLKSGLHISTSEVDTAVRLALNPLHGPLHDSPAPHRLHDFAISTRRGLITPHSKGQADYIEKLRHHNLVFAVGPAGTGKTYIAAAFGVAMLLAGKVDRIILSRPAVEAGEKLGFLPGDLREKVDPYLRPLYDALYDMLPQDQVVNRLAKGEIEVAPLAYMRGRTLSHAYIILDEAQNTSIAQMKMVLTRLGEGSYMVVTGDLTQLDLPPGQISGLMDALRVLETVTGIGFAFLQDTDIIRHPLVRQIVNAYANSEPSKR